MRKNILIVAAIVLIAIGYWVAQSPSSTKNTPPPLDPTNATYVIQGHSVTLTNGRAEQEIAPGSASKLVTQVWSTAMGDLNGDGKTDTAVILTQDGGGSGTFYYVAAAVDGVGGTNGVLLGDRIAPQNIQVLPSGDVLVNYAERKPDEPMTAQPSVGVSGYFHFEGGTLTEFQPAS